MLPCEAFVQVRAVLAADRSQRATLLINNGWILEWVCRRVCFVISSCFAQQEKWAFETWLLVEVLGWTPLPGEGSRVTVREVDYPKACLKVQDPSAIPRLRVLRCIFQAAWA